MAAGIEIASIFVTMALDAKQYTQELDRATGNTRSWASSIGGMAKNAALGIAGAGVAAFAGLGAAIGASTNRAMDLEAQLSAIGAVSGASSTEMDRLKGLINDLGVDPNLKVSAFEAADAIEMLARNGAGVDEIMNGLARSTVLLSNATGGDFAMSADIATDTMALFSDSIKDAESAVDGITSVVNNSKFSIDDYRLALAQGGGVAAATGVEFGDFNTAIAGIAPLFASGSDAGTSFKTMLQRLVPSSGKAAGLMQELGIITADGANQFFDASGNMKSMGQIAGVLSTALGGLSEEQRNAALSTMFGTDAMRAAVGLAELGEKGFSDLQATMGQTSAAENAAKRVDNLAGAMEIFNSVVESVQIQVGDKFIPILRKSVENATQLLSANADTIVAWAGKIADGIAYGTERVQTLGGLVSDFFAGKDLKAAAGLRTEFGEFGSVIFQVISWVRDDLIPAFFEFSDWFQTTGLPAIQQFSRDVLAQLIPGLTLLAGIVVDTATAAWPFLSAAIQFAVDNFNIILPILAVVGAVILAISAPIVALIGVIVLLATAWANNWGGIQEKTQAAFDFIVPLIQTAMTTIQNIVGPILDYLAGWWTRHGDSVITIANFAYSTIVSLAQRYFQVLVSKWSAFVEFVLKIWNDWGSTIMTLAQLTWDNVITIVTAAFEILGYALDVFAALIKRDWHALGDALSGIWRTAWNAVETILDNAKAAIIAIVKNMKEQAIGKIQAMVDGIVESINELKERGVQGLQAFKDKVEEIVSPLKNAFDDIKDDISDVVDFFEDLLDLASQVGNINIPGVWSRSLQISSSPTTGGRGGLGPPPGAGGMIVNNYFNQTNNRYDGGVDDDFGQFSQMQALLST